MKHNIKVILTATIILIFISGCSFLNNNGKSNNNIENESNAQSSNEKGNSEEKSDLQGNVLNINGDEITIAKISDKGNGTSTSPKKGAKVASKDMGKIKITDTTKIIVRNSYGNEGTGTGGRYEDKTGTKNDIKVDSFIEIWMEKDEENTAKMIRITIFNK